MVDKRKVSNGAVPSFLDRYRMDRVDDYSVAAEPMTSGRISPSRLDMNHFDFDRLEDALLALKDPRALRVLIEL